MIRQDLEELLEKSLSDEKFKEIMQAVTNYIKTRRISSGKKTSYKKLLLTAQRNYLNI